MIKIITIFTLFSINCFANGDFRNNITYSIGMISTSLTENASTLEQTDDSVSEEEDENPYTASFAITSVNITWNFYSRNKISYFAKLIAPLMSPEGTTMFLSSGGFNWYFKGLPSTYQFQHNDSLLTITPKFKAFLGMSTGVGYTVYNTVSAKKSDVFFDLSAHIGTSYALGPKWSGTLTAGIGRGTGVATTSINTKFFAGVTHTL